MDTHDPKAFYNMTLMIDFKLYLQRFLRRAIIIVSFLTLISTALFSQSPIENGFELLEKGDFEAAAQFFGEFLESQPDNKTAKICYGRAIGLSSDPIAATKLFQDLSTEYPDDLEVDLNLAESWLWQSKFDNAQKVYDAIIEKHPESFAGLLGAANTYSNLKEYSKAQELIERALTVQPNNPGALTSQKYILLGLAESVRSDGDYAQASEAYETILNYEPEDRSTLINHAINYILWGQLSKAGDVYKDILTLSVDSLEGYLGLSYVELLANNTKASLAYAEEASAYISSHDDTDDQLIIKTLINEANALGVNGKFSSAEKIVSELQSKYDSNVNVDLAEARINLWKRNKGVAKQLYDPIIQSNAQNYDVIMNYVDLLRGYKEDEKAVAYLDSALMIIPGQPDAVRVKRQLQSDNSPMVNLEAFRGSDNGGNLSDNFSATVRLRNFKRFEPFVQFKQRNSFTESSNVKLSIPRFTLGGSYLVNHNSSIEGGIGLAYNSSDEVVESTLLNISAAYNTTVAKHHNLSFKFFTDFQDFTADLVRENLRSSNFEINYSGTTFNGFGLYSQLMYTVQSDDNYRTLIFLSPYYDIDKVPNVKVGLNALYFAFDQQRPTVYFSPSSFYSVEAFASSQNLDNRRANWLYRGFIAYGRQTIAEQDMQSTIRFELEGGYRITDDSVLRIFYNYSNAAQSSATGFSYQTYGARVSYVF